MDITEKKVFRKSFIGGFSKEDVNKYIEESTEKYTAQIKDVEDKFLSADRDRTELSAKLREAEEKIAELTKKNDELCALREKYEALVTEHGDTKVKLTVCEDELSRANTSVSELSARADALTAVEREYTARKAELADIEISARARAAEIVNEAEAQAQQMRIALDEELALRRKNFDDKRSELFHETADTVGGISHLVDALKNEVESMDSRIARIADAARNNVSMLSAAIYDAQDKVGSIQTRLSECDE